MTNRTKTMSALLALIAATYAVCAAADHRRKAVPAHSRGDFRRMTLGDLKIVALTDGTTVRDVCKLVTKISPDDVEKLMHGCRDPEAELSINAFLIDNGKQRFLVDTGAGDLFKPEAGLLTRSLEQAGYSADRIDAVILTHIHADHSGGLMQGGKKTFPTATIYVPQKDAELFLDDTFKSDAPQQMRHIWDEAGKTIGPYVTSGQVRLFAWGVEIVPGISSLPAPGHSVIVVTSHGQELVILGDTIHVAEIQFPRPEAAVRLDMDQDAAVEQRMKLLEDAAKGGYWVAFDHVSFPGIGHVRKSAGTGGFEWVPMPFAVQE